MAAVEGVRQFTWDVLSALLDQPNAPQDSSIVFSALSLALALSMAGAGARGTTESEIRTALKIPVKTSEEWHRAFQESAGILAIPAGGPLKLRLANSIFFDQHAGAKADYFALVKRHYQAQPELADFFHNSEAERVKINQWVDEQTEGKIKELLVQGSLSNRTRMVLVNALYFKATWERQFDPYVTRQEPFTTLDGKVNDVAMMYDFGMSEYLETGEFKAIKKPYISPKGRGFSMVFILPQESGVKGLRSALKGLQKPSSLAGFEWADVQASIPKFKIEFSFEASAILKKLGISQAFGPADFSGMAEAELFISAVVHKAIIEVSEEGTVAAAATAVEMEEESEEDEPKEFVANRPFLILIQEVNSGLILFTGLVKQPRWES